MLELMDIPAPNILARSLTPSWMLGIFTDNANNKNPFIVVTNNFFQNAFAGMLAWENVMPDDLKQYLYSSDPIFPYLTVRGQFKDRIIMNKDVREFVTSQGKTLFLYSFIDNSRLVIAGNEATLSEIIARLEKSAFVR